MKTFGSFQKKSASNKTSIPLTTHLFQSRSFQDTPPAKTIQSKPRSPAEIQAKIDRLRRATPDYSRLGIQTKLTVGAPNDVYEQEADRVADQVMSMPDSAVQQSVQREAMPEEEVQTKPLAALITPLVQREAMPEEEEVQTKPLGDRLQRMDDLEEEEIQTKPESNIQRMDNLEEEELQTKAIAPTLQREEKEEEDLQMKAIAPTLQKEAMPEEEEVQTKAIGDTLQREAMPEDEEVQTKPALQRSPDGSLQAGSSIESQINSSKGGGSPLSDEVRSFMEPRFGADFSQVRIHTDAQADQLNRSVQARAFTTGQDVFFRQGEYNPGSRGGHELIAHELTHVVQQNWGVVEGRKQDSLPIQSYQAKEKAKETSRPRATNKEGIQHAIHPPKLFTKTDETLPTIQRLSHFDSYEWKTEIEDREEIKEFPRFQHIVPLAQGWDGLQDNETLQQLKNAITEVGTNLLEHDDVQAVYDAIAPHTEDLNCEEEDVRNVKQYNFDGPINLTAENVMAWYRLAEGQGTLDDLRYIRHEITEIRHIAGTDWAEGLTMHDPEDEFWDAAYGPGHEAALSEEAQFLANAVNKAENTDYTWLDVACSDAERREEFEAIVPEDTNREEHTIVELAAALTRVKQQRIS